MSDVVTKLASAISLRAAILAAMQPDTRTPEQRATAHAAHLAAKARRAATFHDRHAAIVQPLTGALRAVAVLHSPDDDGTCTGCDFDGMEAEAPEWPCRTIDTITETEGAAYPPVETGKNDQGI